MNIIYLLPPSEGKNIGYTVAQENLSFDFEKPFDIAVNATEKDLKCSGRRYEEGIELNRRLTPNINSLSTSPYLDSSNAPPFSNSLTTLPHPNPLLKEREQDAVGIQENYREVPSYVVELSRDLRKNQTAVEKVLWELLRGRKFYDMKFRRQYAFGRYIADFYCHEHKLVIELDGEVHQSRQEYDSIRDKIIEQYGVSILRIENDEVCQDLHGVCRKILESVPLSFRRGARGEEELRGKNNYLPAINRYSGVMYNAIGYSDLPADSQNYFDTQVYILSGMYGIVRPRDMIGNYKLPIETKGLYKFWGTSITEALNTVGADIIVNLLPNSYQKMIQWEDLNAQIMKVDFYSLPQPLSKIGELKKLTHEVKKVKGEYVANICKQRPENIDDFEGEKVQISQKEYHIRVFV